MKNKPVIHGTFFLIFIDIFIIGSISIIPKLEPFHERSKQNLSFFIWGMIMGIMLSIAIAFFVEFLKDKPASNNRFIIYK